MKHEDARKIIKSETAEAIEYRRALSVVFPQEWTECKKCKTVIRRSDTYVIATKQLNSEYGRTSFDMCEKCLDQVENFLHSDRWFK